MFLTWRAKTTVLMLSTGRQSLFKMGSDTYPVWRSIFGCHARLMHTTEGAASTPSTDKQHAHARTHARTSKQANSTDKPKAREKFRRKYFQQEKRKVSRRPIMYQVHMLPTLTCMIRLSHTWKTYTSQPTPNSLTDPTASETSRT